MSTYEPPTRPLDPQPPVYAVDHVPVEPVPVGPDRIALLADDLRSLRIVTILVGLLALAGLGVGVAALIENEDDDEGRTSLRGRTAQLDQRIDELRADVRRADETSDVTALSRRLRQARDDARAARAAAGQTAQVNGQLRARIDDLTTTNDDLTARVQALEEAGEAAARRGD